MPGRDRVLEIKSDKDVAWYNRSWALINLDRNTTRNLRSLPSNFCIRTVVRYKTSKGDRRVLLELAIEERELLQPLLEREKS